MDAIVYSPKRKLVKDSGAVDETAMSLWVSNYSEGKENIPGRPGESKT